MAALRLFTLGGTDAETALIRSILERHGFSYALHDLEAPGEPERLRRRLLRAGERTPPPPVLLVGRRTIWSASDMPPLEASGELQRELSRAREAHRARAEYKWGVACLHGTGGVRRDPFGAAAWFRRSARRGDPKGMAALATLLVRGEAGLVDEGEASRWYEEAGKRGNHSALLALGCLRLRQAERVPEGARNRLIAATRALDAAAAQGVADAHVCTRACMHAARASVRA